MNKLFVLLNTKAQRKVPIKHLYILVIQLCENCTYQLNILLKIGGSTFCITYKFICVIFHLS